MKYTSLWTQFETQSLAFGLLRKALYPNYLVRGDYGTISIWKPTTDKATPIPLFTIHVHASTKKEDDRFVKRDDGDYTLCGGESARTVVMKVIPELNARVAGQAS